jgi:hypothetical protein
MDFKNLKKNLRNKSLETFAKSLCFLIKNFFMVECKKMFKIFRCNIKTAKHFPAQKSYSVDFILKVSHLVKLCLYFGFPERPNQTWSKCIVEPLASPGHPAGS